MLGKIITRSSVHVLTCSCHAPGTDPGILTTYRPWVSETLGQCNCTTTRCNSLLLRDLCQSELLFGSFLIRVSRIQWMLALGFPTLTDGRISCEERKKCRRCGGITEESPLHFQSVLFPNRLQLLERRGILQACVCSFASPWSRVSRGARSRCWDHFPAHSLSAARRYRRGSTPVLSCVLNPTLHLLLGNIC